MTSLVTDLLNQYGYDILELIGHGGYAECYKIYSRQLLNMGPQLWSAMVLSHEVINLCLSDPENQEKNLARYKKSLDILAKGM